MCYDQTLPGEGRLLVIQGSDSPIMGKKDLRFGNSVRISQHFRIVAPNLVIVG
jgi:hypothetical protein